MKAGSDLGRQTSSQPSFHSFSRKLFFLVFDLILNVSPGVVDMGQISFVKVRLILLQFLLDLLLLFYLLSEVLPHL